MNYNIKRYRKMHGCGTLPASARGDSGACACCSWAAPPLHRWDRTCPGHGRSHLAPWHGRDGTMAQARCLGPLPCSSGDRPGVSLVSS